MHEAIVMLAREAQKHGALLRQSDARFAKQFKRYR